VTVLVRGRLTVLLDRTLKRIQTILLGLLLCLFGGGEALYGQEVEGGDVVAIEVKFSVQNTAKLSSLTLFMVVIAN